MRNCSAPCGLSAGLRKRSSWDQDSSVGVHNAPANHRTAGTQPRSSRCLRLLARATTPQLPGPVVRPSGLALKSGHVRVRKPPFRRSGPRALLFGLFQSFMDTTHGFLSRDGTVLTWRRRPSSSSRFSSNACVLAVCAAGENPSETIGAISSSWNSRATSSTR